MKPNREYEQACAVWLVQLLVAEYRLPICVREVRVAQNWKTKFRFQHLRKFSAFDYDCNMRARYGRRPGLELDWKRLRGDVDAWQNAGDVVSAVMHGWQIFRKWITGRETRPSKLLAIVQRDLSTLRPLDSSTKEAAT